MDYIEPLSQNGQMVIMDYNVNGIVFTKEEVNEYIDTSVNKIFALLGIFEDCSEKKIFDPFFIYLNRIITEFNGIYQLMGIEPFLSLVGNLKGLSAAENLDHKFVKSLTFHCISIVKKAKVV